MTHIRSHVWISILIHRVKKPQMTEDDNSVLENNHDAKLSPGANHHENSIQLNKGGGAKSIYSKN